MAKRQGRRTGRSVRPAHAPKSTTSRAKKSLKVRLPQPLLRKVALEAKALGLTQEEYVRLVLAVSSALRNGLVTSGRVNAKGLLTLVDNPIFAAMLQALAHSVRSQIEKQNDETDDVSSQSDTQTGTKQAEGRAPSTQATPPNGQTRPNGAPQAQVPNRQPAQPGQAEPGQAQPGQAQPGQAQRPVQPGPMYMDPLGAPPPPHRPHTNPPDWAYW